MTKKFLWVGLSLIFVISLIITSCGPAAEEEEEEEVVTPTGAPKYGGTITYLDAIGGVPQTWDANMDNFGTAAALGGIFYERLLAVPYDKGRTGTGEYQFVVRWKPGDIYEGGAGLAESWEFLDDTTVVFHIRQGVMWPAKPSIGLDEPRELTAEDVAFVYNTALEAERVTTLKQLVDSVTVLDRYSVQFNLSHFHSDWPNDLSAQFRLIYSREAYDAGITDWKNFHGTGAYQVVNVVDDVGTFADRNPEYWQKNYLMPDGKRYQLPFADHVTAVVVADDASKIAALRTGKFDAVFNVPWTYEQSLAESSPDLKKWVCHWDGAFIVGMREDRDLFSDKKVRLALNMALERDAINDSLFGGGVVHNFPFPVTWNEALNVDIYTPIEDLPQEVQDSYSYNPERARELLTEAGYPDGFSATIEYGAGGFGGVIDDLASWLKDYWSEIDVDVTLSPQTGAAMFSRERELLYEEMILTFESTFSPYEAFDSFYSWGLRNLSVIRDDYIDEQVMKISEERDLAKAVPQWKALGIYALERIDYVLLPYTRLYTYAWPWLKNYDGETFLSYYSLSPAMMYAWVDEDLKAEVGY